MKELQEFLNRLVKDSLITADLAQSVITQAQDRDPYSLLQAVKILTDEDLLTRQNVLSICEYEHQGPHELADALVELHENALLIPSLSDQLKAMRIQ